ncbi:dihydroorotate dehydrogenase [Clostridiaceae bacterium OttesenSCG-928-D20]|nr:dihydroorotate dehydrogenase [Clostridiaceae bacterium OttesenSCG-928-D20]
MVELNTKLGSVELKNPIIPASGVYGFGLEYLDFYDPNILGAIALKGTTKEPRFGNPLPRIAECESGMINSVGLQNPGIDAFISEELPRLKTIYNEKTIANISGFSIEEYAYCCEKIDGLVDIIEVNISCPNVHNGGMSFGADATEAARVTRAVRSVVKKTPVFLKLSPNVTSITEIAKVCEAEGADGLTLINTLLGMRIDIKTARPIIANKMGGFSGPAIFPVALRMIYECRRAVDIPIMGAGGVSKAADVIEMMMAGASAVQIGAHNLREPMCCKTIIDELPMLMERLNIKKLTDIIGTAD